MNAKRKKKILFICTGNTCRSPLAEAYLKKLCADKKLDIEIKSAGTCAIDGAPASENALNLSSEYGLDLSSHLSSKLTPFLIDSFDMVIAMTSAHREYAMRISQSADKKIKVLLDFSPNGKTGDIADPFGGDIETYRRCFLEMKAALDNLFDMISRES